MFHTFIPYSTLCVLAVVVHQVSSEVSVYNQNSTYIRSFTLDYIAGSQYEKPLQGLIVLANPPNACEPIKKVDFCCNMTQLSKIVLVAGSVTPNCTLEKKIENAANAGFDLAILYGKKLFWWSTLINIYEGSSPGSEIYMNVSKNMSVGDISHSDGQIMKMEYLFRNNTENYFYLEVTFKHSFYYYLMCLTEIIVFILVLVAVGLTIMLTGICIIILVDWCYKHVRKIRRRSHGNREGYLRQPSNQGNQSPTEECTKDAVCPICREKCIDGQKLLVLTQTYCHTRCIVPQMMEKRRKRLVDECKKKYASGKRHSNFEVTSDSESTPLVTPTNAGNTWGTFAGLSKFGKQFYRPGTADQADATREGNGLFKSHNIDILPSTAGSINAPSKSEMSDIQPKSV